ncbi:MAG: F0F1 ATP synthase subunit epsilon [Dysgonamonadaceae bacterium]|jgi:F-type H+-transporting ATPase subunit epsilon|nr:F0F1 ATP synthase subunit epsilon [Dysgonamonadaceae bacterium]
MHLEIISPENILYSGQAASLTLPGLLGSFMILDHHAPIISVLSQGKLTYNANEQETEFAISGGFVEMKNNVVSVCIESLTA